MATIQVQGVRVPSLMYGTAWKEEQTRELVLKALNAGFRAIDTANQRKHYFEAAVGEALHTSGVERDELFIQTKFTYQRGQDHRLPYDPQAPLAKQVEQSFTSSLHNLRVEHIDSYVLHGPWSGRGWSREDREVWQAMERLVAERRARMLGVSNIALEQLKALCSEAATQPAFVQNRCYARTGWDREVRAFCRERSIVYQGFSLLTANQPELDTQPVRDIAQRLKVSMPEVVFAFAAKLGMLPLTGTTKLEHMQRDLASMSLELSNTDLTVIERVATR